MWMTSRGQCPGGVPVNVQEWGRFSNWWRHADNVQGGGGAPGVPPIQVQTLPLAGWIRAWYTISDRSAFWFEIYDKGDVSQVPRLMMGAENLFMSCFFDRAAGAYVDRVLVREALVKITSVTRKVIMTEALLGCQETEVPRRRRR